MATKKRATKKRAVKQSKEVSGLKVSQAIADGESPTIGGDSPTIGIEYIVPPDLPLLYSDNLNIIHTQTEFVVSFLQVQPPIIKSDEDWANIKTIQSKCVARIVIPPAKMPLLLQVFMMNWKRYTEKYLGEVGEDAAESDAETGGNGK